MFKYILVPATGEATDDHVFRTALAIARPCGAHLAFLHVRIDTQADSDSGRRLRASLRWHNPATTLRVLRTAAGSRWRPCCSPWTRKGPPA